MIKITSFKGIYRFLSNFYYPCIVVFNGVAYPSVEHAFQVAKTYSKKERRKIRCAITPAIAKKIGQTVTLRDDWEDVKLGVMKRLLLSKFTLNSKLADQLEQTNNAKLIEGNRWGDTFWGVCEGKGENHLGRILMEVREELRQ